MNIEQVKVVILSDIFWQSIVCELCEFAINLIFNIIHSLCPLPTCRALSECSFGLYHLGLLCVLTKDGETPLFWASQKGHVEVVKVLLAHPRIKVN